MGASESKLEFKEDIFRLAGEDSIPLDSSWWSRFIQLPETAEDVQALWSPNDLRRLTLNTPADRPPRDAQIAPRKNAETLIYRTISRLHLLQTKRVYDDPQAPITPEVLNGVRILTRLLPYVYEADHLAEWEDAFFWQPRKPAPYSDPKTSSRVYLDGLSGKAISEERKNSNIGPPLGEQLVDILINYLFFPGFTLPAKKDENGLPELRPVYAVWQSGIGANRGVGMTKENERNAVEVLRLLLVVAGRSLYFSPNVVAEKDIKPLTYLTTQADRAIVLNTICSLLNTVLKYNQNPWVFPMDLGATKDSKQPLVTYSLQFLLVLITYPVPNNSANEFRKALGRLHRVEDFQFVAEGLRQILVQPTSAVLGPMQRLAASAPPIATETLSLFWELLQCSKRFRSYLIESDRARDFVVLVLYYAIESKDDPARQSVVRMCVFILQTLSVEERFGQKLNLSFLGQEKLPTLLQIPSFHGTYADFLIGHVHNLLTSGNRGLESLYPALLAIINNIAPYVKGLQKATSSMLMNLFVSMSQPSFLLANEANHVLLFSLLDAMNAILEHQYKENRRFVDTIIKGRKRFEALREFTVEGAETELNRWTMERKDAGESASVRNPSQELVRSPTSTRSPSLDNVPEDSAFSIGDDDDDDHDNDINPGDRGVSTVASVANDADDDDALPIQSRNMSEKARGKQPVGNSNFSRSTSRNTSNTSLPSLARLQTRPLRHPFTPDYQWLHSWLPHVPLHTILQTIENFEAPNHPNGSMDDMSAYSAPAPGATSRRAGEFTPLEVKEVKVQTFRWTNLALGWYLSLLWGRIYAADSARTWVGTNVRLFNVVSQQNKISLSSPKGAVDAVGDTIAKRIGSISFHRELTSREV